MPAGDFRVRVHYFDHGAHATAPPVNYSVRVVSNENDPNRRTYIGTVDQSGAGDETRADPDLPGSDPDWADVVTIPCRNSSLPLDCTLP